MKIGISSYSLDPVIASGKLNLLGAIDWAAAEGAECMELVPFSFKFLDTESGVIDSDFINKTVKKAKDAGVELVNYSVLANLCKEGAEFEAEIARIKREIDVVAELGIPRMRHDISAFRRPIGENGLDHFDRLLPQMIDGATRLTEYGKSLGIETLIENHGFFVNGCDRVERVLNGVNNDNYGLLLDTGNIACMDEDPYVATLRLAPRARMIHLKDFYIRKQDPGDTTQFDCLGHWFRSLAGYYLRGSILAQGDLDVPGMLTAIKNSGYDGNIVIEFEGMEDAEYATRVSLKNAQRIMASV